MTNDELLDFIHTEQEAGMNPRDIRKILETEGGWDKGDVDEAFNMLGIVEFLPVTPPAHVEANTSQEVREDFLGIFSTSASAPVVAPEPASLPQPSPASPPSIPSSDTPPPAVLSPQVSPNVTPAPQVSPPASAPEEKPKPVFNFSLEKALLNSTAPKTEAPSPEVKSSEGSFEQLLTKVGNDEVIKTKPPEVRVGLPGAETLPRTLEEVSNATANVTFEKPLQTKPLNEVWAQSLATKSSPPAPSVSVSPAAPSVQKETSPLLGKRTMASDILLRGRGAVTPGMPAIALPEPTKMPVMSVAPSLSLAPEPLRKPLLPQEAKPIPPAPALAEVLARKNKTKRILFLALIALVTLLVLVGGVFAFMQSRGPDTQTVLTKAFGNFLAASSFGYKGSMSSDVVLSPTQNGVGKNGSVKFTSEYNGTLLQSASGFGDGLHRLKFTGGLQLGTFLWNTDVEADLRMFGTALYMHILSFPQTKTVDPDLFKTYWIKIDIAEIAKELMLSGAVTPEGYGTFGRESDATTFTALLAKEFPFTAGEELPKEVVGGISATHIRLTALPDRMLALSTLLYHKFTNKNLVLDSEQQLRLKDAFAKIKGEVWIDPNTNTLLKLSIQGDFDDDMAGFHLKGPIRVAVEFSGQGQAVVVTPPTPMLTLEELRARMDDFKKTQAARARDQVKIDQVATIVSALETYRTEKGRYPSFLSDLTQANMLASSTFDTFTLKSFFYASYVKPEVLTKAGRCVVKGKLCAGAHVGVNLEDMRNPALETDADQTTDVYGLDRGGCADEKDVACYDVFLGGASSTPAPIIAQ